MNIRTLSAIGLMGLAMIGASPSARAQPVLTIGTNQPGTIFHSAGSAIAKVVKDAKDIEMRVQPFAGSGPLLALIEQKKLDFAIVNVFEMSQAMNGREPFSEEHPNLRVVSSLFKTHVGFLVPADSPIEELADIRGKSVASGYSSAPIIELMRQAIMANAGVEDGEVTAVPVPNSVRGGDLMESGRVDVAFLSLGSGKVAELDAALGGVRFLSLSPEDGDVAAMREVMPQGSALAVQPAPNRPGVGKGTRLLGYDIVLVTHEDTDAETVQAVLDVLANEQDALAQSLPSFDELTVEAMGGVPNIPYHPAAEQAFETLGSAE
ncbi:TAXI family TRAP transporter solute-binding subunit [Arenibaculum sp.]|jgi:hypothetical protein|uniref:TAXI family TRAP transporter solute-binding subunit n=1 Tax=Arenibaculum sp. TaxID=2865862 RepID=UPI002E1025DE|nr:TAXI family TRAP transporter solute-binding subunit [Arenibaculum sp.]